jgi:hypothetical protein
VDESCVDKKNNPEYLKAICQDYGLDLHIVSLESMPIGSKMFMDVYNSMSTSTSKRELVTLHKRKLLEKAATDLGYFSCINCSCNVLMTAENATRTAINIISNTCKGRGIALPLDISLESSWNKGTLAILLFVRYRYFKAIQGH